MSDSIWKDPPFYYIVIIPTLAIVAFAIIFSYLLSRARQDFLKQHGCQLISQNETGRRVYCGRACLRPEVLSFYECAKGNRFELR